LYLDGRLTLQKLGAAEQEISYFRERRGFAGDCCYAAQRHFTDCLLTGERCETSGEEYLKTMLIQEAVYQSSAAKTAVSIEAMTRQ
jgi:hypothetical protein